MGNSVMSDPCHNVSRVMKSDTYVKNNKTIRANKDIHAEYSTCGIRYNPLADCFCYEKRKERATQEAAIKCTEMVICPCPFVTVLMRSV